MQTQPKSVIHQPKIHPSLFLTHLELKMSKKALEDANCLAAMHQEYDAFFKQNTWDLVCLPPHRQVIGCKGW